MMKKKMIDAWESPFLSGIFSGFVDADVPWDNTNEADNLNLIYYAQRSGEKLISPMTRKMLGEDGYVSNTNTTALAAALVSFFGSKWNKIWAVMVAEYNPLSNYDMTEEAHDVTKHTGKDTTTKSGSLDRSGAITKTGSERDNGDTTRTGSIESAGTQNDNAEASTHSIYGFNSANAVPADGDSKSASHKDTQTFNQVKDATDITHTYTDVAETDTRKDTYNNIKDELDRNTKDEYDHALTRSGNIGVTTSQQMALSEWELRRNLFFNEVMMDIDSFLTLPVYTGVI